MAQLDAAGDAVTSDSTAATDPIMEAADSFFEDEQEEETAEGEDEAPDGDEAETDEADDSDIEDEAEDGEDDSDLPPIEPPVSLTAEEKEAFKNLPREAQEFTARRIGELEKGFQTKAQEAARARAEAETQAISQVVEIERKAVERLQQLSASLLPQEPDPRLLRGSEDQRAYYYEQRAIYEQAEAQQRQLQQEVMQREQRAQAYEQELTAREAAESQRVLSEQFPEFLDPAQAELRQSLTSTAAALGYSQEQINSASAADILAMRTAAEWKAKADKLDGLNAKKMESVRVHKGLPKVTRPGTARSKAQNSASRRAEAWEKAKSTRDPLAFADAIGLE